jgi:hypothetical protein
MHVSNGVLDNFDERNWRGQLLAVPLAVGLVFVVWGWPRVIGQMRVDLAEIRRERSQHASGVGL